jgi:hypothetical protein
LGERLLCKQEVIGSIPFTSTIWHPPAPRGGRRGAGWDVRRRLRDTARVLSRGGVLIEG